MQSFAVFRKVRSLIIVILILLVSAAGLSRLSFATDVLEILPQDVAEVQALNMFRQNFDDDNHIILLLRHEEEIYEEDAEDFAAFLGERLPEARVEYRSRFEDDPTTFALSLARMWADADEELVAELAGQLKDPAALERLLEESKRKIELSLDQGEATMRAYDPIGFLDHPAMKQLKESNFSFQSEDGKMWLIMIAREDLGFAYEDHSNWVSRIREAANQWDEEGFSYTLTGRPVLGAEVGEGMERDMTGTVVITSIIVGLLFLLVQRSAVQLAVLGGILILVFMITLGLAGWIFGTLNLVSVGFAAILLGLVIDYGVVIAREAASGQSAAEVRREMAPGILWAALTTAAVFGLLMLSTFAGIQQLGGLILIGLVTGALVCLWIMPWAMEKFRPKPSSGLLAAPFLGARFGGLSLVFGIVGSIAVFVFIGTPYISFKISMVEPEVSEAAQTFDVIQENYPAWSKRNLTLITHGETLPEVRESLKFAQKEISRLKEDGFLVRSEWPTEILPDPVARVANAEQWREVSAKSKEIVAALSAAGFSKKGYELDQLVLESLGAIPDELDPFARMFYNEKGFFAGRVQLKDASSEDSIEKLAAFREHGVTASGWQLLQVVLLPMVKKDFYFLFLPATLVLLSALIIVFRSWKDALMTAAVLVTVLLLINAVSVLVDRPWNFLSSMAIPLTVGTGIDYSIHLIFALRRSEGDLVKVWNGVGKAIFFCGFSTVVGFGSLALASNQTLQSMGILCGAGVFLTMIFSVLVVPGLWCLCHRKDGMQSKS